MSSDLRDIAAKCFDISMKAGLEQADILVVNGVAESAEVANGKLEQVERSEGIDLGLRGIIGTRQACVSISDLSDRAIAEMAERVVAMAKAAPEDPNCRLAEPDQLVKDWDADALRLIDPSTPPSAMALKDRALEAEAAALKVKGVNKTQSAGASYSRTEVFIQNSNGFSGGYARTGFSTSCVAIAGEGLKMERDWAGEMRNFQADMPSAEEIGTLAGTRAVERYDPKRAPKGVYPVLFDERVSSSLIGHFLAAINGSAIARGSSWLKDAMGAQVFPDHIDLIEDPLRPSVSGSKPFDAEGLKTEKRAIVEKGVLQGWTLDLSTARQLGLESTANASRGVSSPPSPSSGNMALTQSTQTRADLLKDMGTGLLVTSMIGSTINPNTGDYSRGASGYWVENGVLAYPVNEITIAGNLRDMLKSMRTANDARAHLSRVIPSILIESMTVASS